MAVVVCVPLIGFGLAPCNENPREIPRSFRNDKINVFPLTEKLCPFTASNGLTPEGGATGNAQNRMMRENL